MLGSIGSVIFIVFSFCYAYNDLGVPERCIFPIGSIGLSVVALSDRRVSINIAQTGSLLGG